MMKWLSLSACCICLFLAGCAGMGCPTGVQHTGEAYDTALSLKAVKAVALGTAMVEEHRIPQCIPKLSASVWLDRKSKAEAVLMMRLIQKWQP